MEGYRLAFRKSRQKRKKRICLLAHVRGIHLHQDTKQFVTQRLHQRVEMALNILVASL